MTELVTGLDLVEQQLRVAAGEPLGLESRDPEGHAVEVRLYAEDPLTFLPQAGRIESLVLPEGVRVDAGVEAGDEVPVAYDPMIAKLVAAGETRDDALDRLAEALAETRVGGVTTNLPFLRWLVAHPGGARGRGDDRLPDGASAALAPAARPAGLAGPLAARARPRRAAARARGAAARRAAAHASDGAHGESNVVAPMPGTVIRVLAAEGDRVERRQPLVVLEAMKMETPLLSPFDATVRARPRRRGRPRHRRRGARRARSLSGRVRHGQVGLRDSVQRTRKRGRPRLPRLSDTV